MGWIVNQVSQVPSPTVRNYLARSVLSDFHVTHVSFVEVAKHLVIEVSKLCKPKDLPDFVLDFHDCCHVELEMEEHDIEGREILSTVLLDSAKLKIWTSKLNMHLYHARIELDYGYLDVIFKNLEVKVSRGEVELDQGTDVMTISRFDHFLSGMSTSEIRDIARKSNQHDDCEIALLSLCNRNDACIIEIAIENLESYDQDEADELSIYALARFGTMDHLNLLAIVLAKAPWMTRKRQVQDAIELIIYRNVEK